MAEMEENALENGEPMDAPEVADAQKVIPKPPKAKPSSVAEEKVDAKSLPLKSIVKIFVTKVPVRYGSPWNKGHQSKSTGTGFCIASDSKQRLVLTNAHVVHQHTVIRVRRPGCTTKFVAKLVCIGREVDLALLSVADDEFWSGISLLTLDRTLPNLDDNVTAVGYPTGGDGISITRGVVSRMCLNSYVTGGQSLLTVQIDAAINHGNSGGPVFNSKTKKVVGVAQSIIALSQNIGYIIAVPVIELFLSQFETTGSFPGCASLEVHVQSLESPALREQLMIPDEIKGGIRVRSVSPLSPLHGLIKPDDVVLKIFDQDIANDITVPLSDDRPDERLSVVHLITSRPVGTECQLEVWSKEAQKIVQLSCILRPAWHLVPILHEVDCLARYFIIGGLVFIPLSRPWLREAYSKKTPNCAIASYLYEYPDDPEQEIVILVRVLSAEVNFGFQSLGHAAVRDFNGVKVKNLNHLADMVTNCTDKFISLTLHYHTKITLNREECAKSEELILSQHSIDAPRRLENVRSVFKSQTDGDGDVDAPPKVAQENGAGVNGNKMVDVDSGAGVGAGAVATSASSASFDPSACAL